MIGCMITTQQPDAVTARGQQFRPIKLLVLCYVALAVVGFGVTLGLRDDPQFVDTTVWVRNSTVLLTSVLMYGLAESAARGNRSAFKRLRIVSIVIPVAVIVLIAIPGAIPMWMKLQQALCGLVVAAVAVQLARFVSRD
jgi:hypothetical protein